MSTDPTPPLPPGGSAAPEAGSVPSLARRRLLRGGLGVAPVLMAAAPRSVMAGNGLCVNGSAYTSWSPNTAVSRSTTPVACTGKTPADWVAATTWPTYVRTSITGGAQATMFHSVFPEKPSAGSYGTGTFLEILQLPDTGQSGVAKHLVAAALNAAAGLTPDSVAGLTILQSIWRQYALTGGGISGHYIPTGTVRWYHDSSSPVGAGGIIPWLRSTMVG
ncbi:MAG TPA: hypothetical protein VFQ20_10905 [Burkholderiaceae bacterium]|nr:hypothetical protein [Burkholderiaceae bacterium]